MGAMEIVKGEINKLFSMEIDIQGLLHLEATVVDGIRTTNRSFILLDS